MNQINNKNFYETVYDIFYKFSQTKPEQVGLVFSKKCVYPLMELNPKVQFTIPLPIRIEGNYVFEGMLYENTDEGRKSLWNSFLVTIYHLAGHAAISDYSVYEFWKKNKTPDMSWQVIDFIEDIKVETFLSQKDTDIWNNIVNFESKFENFVNKQSEEENPGDIYNDQQTVENRKFIKGILSYKHSNSAITLKVADLLFYDRKLMTNSFRPYREQHETKWFLKFDKTAPKIRAVGILEESVQRLDDLWEFEIRSKDKLLRIYNKFLKDLRFDSIVVPLGNLQKYEEIKTSVSPMMRTIRHQLRLVTNVNDSPKIDQIGYVDMQMAIQAIASEGATTDIFEQDELRRAEESWVILVDTSASMMLRFDEVREFVVCISECANDLTGKTDNWALFTFDNNFNIIKDFKEKFNQEVKARIGGIKNTGLSLMPDALELSFRALNATSAEKRYIFVLTDGRPSGYEKINEAFLKVMKKTGISGVTVIGIGVSKKISEGFRNNVRANDLKQLVSKFITAYKTVASDV